MHYIVLITDSLVAIPHRMTDPVTPFTPLQAPFTPLPLW